MKRLEIPLRTTAKIAVGSQKMLNMSKLQAKLIRVTPTGTRRKDTPNAQWYIQLAQVVPRKQALREPIAGSLTLVREEHEHTDDPELVGLVEVPFTEFMREAHRLIAEHSTSEQKGQQT